MRIAKIYALCLLVFLAIDATWLGVIAPKFYFGQLGDLLRTDPLWTAAALFYAIYIGGIVYFAVLPGLEKKSARCALKQGAILGFFGYATYDLTNWATIAEWTATVVVVDLAWGTFLTGLTAGVTTWIIQRFFSKNL